MMNKYPILKCPVTNPHDNTLLSKEAEIPLFQDCEFLGNKFITTCVGSYEPLWNLYSFISETFLKERWWKVQPGDVVADVGAAYGSWTLISILLGASKVYAFEPSKHDFFDLCSNLFVNSLTERCTPLNVLLGEENNITEFYEESHSSTNKKGQVSLRLQTTLDQVVSNYKITRLDWLKIDVEGAEIEVLNGARETLKILKPKIFLEVHPDFTPDAEERSKEILMSLGYKGVLCTWSESKERWFFWEPASDQDAGQV